METLKNTGNRGKVMLWLRCCGRVLYFSCLFSMLSCREETQHHTAKTSKKFSLGVSKTVRQLGRQTDRLRRRQLAHLAVRQLDS